MKWLFVILIIGAIVYTFRDTAGPILEQLKETTPSVLAGICVMSGIYCLVEALITTVLAKQYNPDFRYQWGIENMFFCSFYRVATLGSGSGVAAIIYLNEHGVDYSKGFGMYMLQYAFHKISIAIYSAIFFFPKLELYVRTFWRLYLAASGRVCYYHGDHTGTDPVLLFHKVPSADFCNA